MKTNEILLGDCYEMIKQIPDKSIDLVYTDIPYLMHTDGGGLGGSRPVYQGQLKNFDNGIDMHLLDEFVRVCKKIYCYIWCSKDQILDIGNYFVSKGCSFNILVWCKTNPTPFANNTFLPDVEYCLVCRENGTKLNDGIELKSKWYIHKTNVADKKEYLHPTIKPLELVERHILHSTLPEALVLDPFMGSGTTAVACKETGRNFIGFEIDEKYWQIANDRLHGITARGAMSLLDMDYEEKVKHEEIVSCCSLLDYDEVEKDGNEK